MTDVIQVRAGVPVLVCDPDGPRISSANDALELIGATFRGAEVVAVPTVRLDERFFSLSTGVAGEVVQKFTTYKVLLAIVGDVSSYLAASSALRAFVHESDRAGHVWFVPDFDALDARLAARSASRP
ncbi:DUF4180 domain-containing protein [Thermasporomyces composti]|uniref:Uncharacterized protein DUF4180 n=1 Tax=Thermasporomyces composti TaxID=696763 RepID=A0A3D9V425_THECX|nr:DUF4180 domain-containing protein [Thermasporomyces composti]REF36267.1 uncharacterized protein DUF4180 [Thermasporomyces composti]